MSQPRRLGRTIVWLAALSGAAGCGASDESVDPGDLELRDLLGVAPRVAVTWDDAQRAAARQVLAAGLDGDTGLALAEVGAIANDAAVVHALALVDDRRLDAGRDALGLVVIERRGAAAAGRALEAIVTGATLRGERRDDAVAAVAVELDPRAWPCPTAPACNLDVLTDLATDAAPGAARVRVVPVVQLAVIAALVTDDDGTPTLLVNPIVTAVGEPTAAAAAASSDLAAPDRMAPLTAAAIIALPLVTTAWVYADSIDSCAQAVQSDCGTCLAGGLCEPIWAGMTGMEACTLLAANPSRNYALLCANLAVSLSDLAACIADHSANCPIDAAAIGSAAGLEANASFLDDAACVNAMSVCLTQLYGAEADDSCGSCGSCDCGSCDSSSNDSGCSSTDDNTDNCNDNSGCNGGGCNDSGGGGGCGGGGGGGSCAVARQPSRGAGVAVGLMWVLLPVPAALLARRRSRRRSTDRVPADPA